METVFGPVPSRRLGQSLGIDPVPIKSCNWNCVYCQLGRTRRPILERQVFFSTEKILQEASVQLEDHEPGEIDWVTFIGSGETTLHAGLGEMILGVKALTNLPVAVITNGSLLYLSEVRRELLPADAVLPSLDAGNPDLYRRINRPHSGLSFESLVRGITTFQREYAGKLWVEVMLIHGLNDTEEALQEIAAVLRDVHPDAVHLMLPTRPPAEKWVQPAGRDGLVRAQAILGQVAQVFTPARGRFDLSRSENPLESLLSIIKRHPMRESELKDALNEQYPDSAEAILAALEKSSKAQRIIRYGVPFWTDKATHFAENKNTN
jgi:wyosine [tRNA(Phe)-imidazoG37] synthetase (radical SAM superfamily)